jgi:MoaA/NifB/PqqE/SkfB family radical SAM enzyme
MNYVFREFISIFKNIYNFKKILNIILVLFSYTLSKFFRKEIIFGYPFMIMIEPTNICNLKCPLCITGTNQMIRPQGFMSFEKFSQIFHEIKKHVIHLTMWSQGEPFINKDFSKMVKLASENGVRTMTSTNGHFLMDSADEIIESGLSYLIVSVDGLTKESYEKYRVGGKFNILNDGIIKLVQKKKLYKSRNPEIELQFLVMNIMNTKLII